MTWRSDLIQAVIFPQPGQSQPEALKLWTSIFGDRGPDNFQRASSSPQSQTTASGKIDEFSWTIASQLGRIDVYCQAAPVDGTNELPEVTPPQIENYADVCKKVSFVASKVAAQTNVARLAIALQLSEHVDVGKEAILVAEKTGIAFPNDSLDPIYQFNVRSPFKTFPTVQMNRLCTFSAGLYQLVAVGQIGTPVPVAMASKPFVSFKIDVNTMVGTEISTLDPALLLEELTSEAIRISEKGVGAFK
jgi:hypothetical protein